MERNIESTLLTINKKAYISNSFYSMRKISAVQYSNKILTVSRSVLLKDTGFKMKK